MSAVLNEQTIELQAQEVQHHPAPAVQQRAVVATPTPADLLRIAVEGGADLDRLERLMDLQARWEAAEAKKAAVQAMTRFKAEPLEIFKRKKVDFATRDGDRVTYKHAELSDVTDAVGPAMARHGLSFRWNVQQEKDRITVDCIVTHERGHSETVTMFAAPDVSGKKNHIQQVASTVTYLQRYTLLAATGMATKGVDDDGRESEVPETLRELISELRETSTDAQALEFWKAHRGQFSKDKHAYERFKDEVAAHRTELREGSHE